jgi:colanic acid biosynthesis glycosyl transferase WcaI
MRILMLSINYAPEPTGFAPHVATLCEHLASRGHDVMVLTGFPFAPYWSRWPEYKGQLTKREYLNGVQVVRLTHFIPRRAGHMLQRLLMEGSFCQMAVGVLLTQMRPRWDVILYVGAQPSIAMLAKWMAHACRIPYVVSIQDLAAQAAAGVGIVKAPWLVRLLDKFEYSAYNSASGAMVLCEAFRSALVCHGYPAERIRVIASPVDVERIRPIPPDPSFRQEQQLAQNDFVVLYSGSMGLKQGLTNVVEAARLLEGSCPVIKWVLVGEGELKPVLHELVRKYDLGEQVRVLPLQPEARMSAMFSSANVLLLNQLSTVKDTVIPSKLLTYMAAGRGVLAAVSPSSQAAILLDKAQGGLLVKPEDPVALANAVKHLQAGPDALRAMGQHNREYAEKNFDQRRVVAAQEAFLLEIVGDGHRG